MSNNEIIKRIKSHPSVEAGASVGVVSSYGKGAEVVIKGVDTRDIVVVANTRDIDLEEEVVDPRGADTSYFMSNKAVFADHQYGMDMVAGSARQILKYPSEQDHQSWRVRVRVADTPVGQTVQTIVSELGQIGVSIGFISQDAGPPDAEEKKAFAGADGTVPKSIVRLWKWFELSFTAIPCNVACQSLAVSTQKSVDMIDGIDRLVSKGLIDRKYASALGAPMDAERRYHAVTTPRSILGVGGVIAVRRV